VDELLDVGLVEMAGGVELVDELARGHSEAGQRLAGRLQGGLGVGDSGRLVAGAFGDHGQVMRASALRIGVRSMPVSVTPSRSTSSAYSCASGSRCRMR
jgi:hypothetical protein